MVTIIDPHIKREGGYHIHEASFTFSQSAHSWSVCPSFHLSVTQSFSPSVSQPASQSVHPSISQSVNQSDRQSVSQSVRLSICVHQFAHLSVKSIFLSVNITLLFECLTQEATRLGHYVKNKDGGEYENWCWPGNYCGFR